MSQMCGRNCSNHPDADSKCPGVALRRTRFKAEVMFAAVEVKNTNKIRKVLTQKRRHTRLFSHASDAKGDNFSSHAGSHPEAHIIHRVWSLCN